MFSFFIFFFFDFASLKKCRLCKTLVYKNSSSETPNKQANLSYYNSPERDATNELDLKIYVMVGNLFFFNFLSTKKKRYSTKNFSFLHSRNLFKKITQKIV